MSESLSPEFVTLQQAVAGRYSLERELGRGGMGIVYLARDVALDRLVAIKLLPPAQAAQPGLRERFMREARTAAKLSHPNIVPIYLVEEAGGLVFFVMAFVEGETLGQRLRGRGPLSPVFGTRLLQEVAWALAYAHLRGIVHRDVKPDNILIEQGTNRAMVSDFGIARAGETSGSTAIGEILGTAQYMSPEQASGEKVDGRSDLYSLGIVGFYALAGRPPFEADSVPALLAMQITRPAPPLSSTAPGVPAKVAQAIDKCLAKSPDDRWPTGEAFAEALARSTAVARETPAPVRSWLERGERMRGPIILFSAYSGLGVLGALISIFRHGGGFPWPLLVFALPLTALALARIRQTHRVFVAGYTADDLRLALRQQVDRRREELAFEYGAEPARWAKLVRIGTFVSLGTAVASGSALAMLDVRYQVVLATVFSSSIAATALGALVGRFFPGKRLTPKDRVLELRLKLWSGPIGRWMTRLAGIGLRRSLSPGAGAHRPTELAIGMAADQIFESLPKDSRKALKDLPALVRRLEAEAQGVRARVDELNAMIAGIGDEALSAQSASLKRQEAGALVADQRELLRTELHTKRDQAAQRLAVAVAALENIRLDLLRLKAGVGTVDQLTADLNAARDLEKEIDLAVEANREVEAVLRAGPAAS